MSRARPEQLLAAKDAAEWFDALAESDESDRKAFSEWITRSPLHVQEFLNVSAIHRMFDKVDAERNIDVRSLLEGSGGLNVIGIGEGANSRNHGGNTVGTTRRTWLALAAAVTFAAAGLAWWHSAQIGNVHYETPVGEQRTVHLDDGSLVYLNADSRMEARLDEARREVRLLTGEALFDIRRDASRPFQVQTGKALIDVLGTQFNVRNSERETRVAVIEGAVQVTDVTNTRLKITTGQEARLDAGGAMMQHGSVDPAKATAWRQRRLVFEGDTLEDIAAEFNRYNRAPKIRIEGEEIQHRRFTGVLDADRPESLSRMLGEADDVDVRREGEELVIRARTN